MIPDLDGQTGDFPDEDDADDESGDGEDQASLALNVPEPARAAAAGKAPKDDVKSLRKRKGKFAKAREGMKSALGDSFLITAYQGIGDNSKSTAIQVTLDAAAFGLETAPAPAPAPEPEPEEMSTFDRDEITDREMTDEIELISLLAGMKEKPWENEKLSLVERMMLRQGYERNLEALQPDGEPNDTDPAKKTGKRDTVKAAAAVIAGVAVAGAAQAQDSLRGKNGPAIAGVSRGPRREADQDRAQMRNEAEKPAVSARPLSAAALREERERQEMEKAGLRRAGTIAAATLGTGAALKGMGPLHDRSDNPAMNMLLYDLMYSENRQNSANFPPVTPDPGPVSGSVPSSDMDSDAQFHQTLNTLYANLGLDIMAGVSPYRQAGWEEKYLEQQENSADITAAPPAPVPQAPAPEPVFRQEFEMNFGPSTM